MNEGTGSNTGQYTGSHGRITTAVGTTTSVFVDQTLASDITNGTYSIANRNNSGSAGNAYANLQTALDNHTVGHHIILRGGTHVSLVTNQGFIIEPRLNGSSWNDGQYNRIESLNTTNGGSTNEWAVLDGQFACGAVSSAAGGQVIGYGIQGPTTAHDIKYWHFERIEIKNGRANLGAEPNKAGFGFHGNGGPFKFRFCYIHDNIGTDPSSPCGNLPAGTWGYNWKDSIVEYNYYLDNGGTSQNNCKQIGWVAQYPHNVSQKEIADTGFTTTKQCGYDKDNEIRYNLVVGGNVGIGVKHFSIFTSRTATNGYDDTFKDYGTKIHHNICIGQAGYAIGIHADFGQAYNNIIDACGETAIYTSGYTRTSSYWKLYKVTAYNNTIINPLRYGFIGLFQRVTTGYLALDIKYTFNNIVDNSDVSNQYCTEAPIMPQMHCLGDPQIDFSGHITSNNYSYRPGSSQQYKLAQTLYTPAEFELQTITTAPRVAYSNAFNASDPLYVGTTGADRYVPNAGHVVDTVSGETISNGGKGGAHPFLAAVTIPSYIGAVDPADTTWVYSIYALDTFDAGVPTNLRDAIAPI